jgi:ELWxxDGT repeat protein
VKDIVLYNPAYLIAVGSTLYFCGNDGTHGWQPWKSDGTGDGTVMIDTKVSTSQQYLTAAGAIVYFSAYDDEHEWELWKLE